MKTALGCKIGEDEAALALEHLAGEDENAAAFLDVLVKDQEQRAHRTEEVLTYEQAKTIIEDPKGARKISRLPRWGKNASVSDLMLAASDFMKEEEPERLYGYVLVFLKRPFPLEPEKLIALARGLPDIRADYFEENINYKIALQSWNAMKHIRHSSVRALALDSLHLTHWADRAVGAFISNYRDGDHTLIEECLLQQQSEWYFHDVSFSALHVFEANSTPDSKNILTTIYERGPCSICRGRVIEQLITLRQLTQWMAEECRYDANNDIRERVAAYLGRQQASFLNPARLSE